MFQLIHRMMLTRKVTDVYAYIIIIVKVNIENLRNFFSH